MQERNSKGQFIKGMIPWNKGKKGYMGVNKTSFTSESVEKQRTKYKLGEAHKPDKRDGHLTCRIEEKIERIDKKTGKKYLYRKRISYCKNLLITNGIQVPKGYVVYHVDGDITNNSLSNLIVISRAELLRLNLHK